MVSTWLTAFLVSAGVAFFISGVVGLLRLPDLYCRLHALTKADNVGLGLIVLGLMFQADGVAAVLKLGLIWLLVLVASAGACSIVAQAALRRDGIRVGSRPNE